MIDERKFIASIGTVGTILIAGCSGTSESDSEDSESEAETISPVEVVKQQETAIESRDFEAINESIHPNSTLSYSEEGTPENIIFNEPRRISVSDEDYIELVAENAKSLDEEGVQSIDSNVQEAVQENGFEDYTIVLSSFELDGETFEGEPVWLIKDGDQWYIWA